MSLFIGFPTVHSVIHAFFFLTILLLMLLSNLCSGSTAKCQRIALFSTLLSHLSIPSVDFPHVIYKHIFYEILKQMAPLTSQRCDRKHWVVFRGEVCPSDLRFKKSKQPKTFFFNLLRNDTDVSQNLHLK